jgi:hypothetical protein
MVLDCMQKGLDWATASPREDYATIYRGKCEEAGVHFDDLVNGLRCEDSMVAVPRLNPNLLSGFARDSVGHETAELYLKVPEMIGRNRFCEVLKRFIEVHETYFRPLIEWCT